MTTTTVDAKCTTVPGCESREAVAIGTESGEITCAAHLSVWQAGEARFAAETAPAEAPAATPVYTGPLLVALTGSRVHYPAMIDQQGTHRTACAPYGRMGLRQMRLRWASDPKWTVDCKSCLKTKGPQAAA